MQKLFKITYPLITGKPYEAKQQAVSRSKIPVQFVPLPLYYKAFLEAIK